MVRTSSTTSALARDRTNSRSDSSSRNRRGSVRFTAGEISERSISRITVAARPRPGDRVHQLEVERPRKCREASEYQLLVVVEQIPSPVERCLQGAVPTGGTDPVERPEAVVQMGRELSQRDVPHPGRSELDRKRQPVEPTTDLPSDIAIRVR